jgi:hypothetical protein
MVVSNAFINHTAQPTPSEIESALHPTAALWQGLIEWLGAEHGVSGQEWKSTSPKYGWSLRMKLKQRTIVYLAPCNGCFRAAFVLGARAVAAAHQTNLPESVVKAIDKAPRYAEGTGVALIVRGPDDLVAVQKIAQIKLAN